jgi:murein DD-endopeptidase MepM/ murein hydrolase activator NlpD
MPIYAALVAVFFFSLLLLVGLVALQLARALGPRGWHWRWWGQHRRATQWFYGVWFGAYALFIAFGTGPEDLALYPPRASSPYKLPWRAGVTRLVAQGNRSFASHRGGHMRAWDFWMSIGTEILAARAGEVVEVEDSLDGIGLRSNFVTIEHDDGTRAVYAHIRKGGAAVRVGDRVRQGQLVAWSGVVGQTVFPHLHFVVTNREGTASVPISFADVPDGVPLAGRWYASENAGR